MAQARIHNIVSEMGQGPELMSWLDFLLRRWILTS